MYNSTCIVVRNVDTAMNNSFVFLITLLLLYNTVWHTVLGMHTSAPKIPIGVCMHILDSEWSNRRRLVKKGKAGWCGVVLLKLIYLAKQWAMTVLMLHLLGAAAPLLSPEGPNSECSICIIHYHRQRKGWFTRKF